jgi:hypothetical protein
MTPTECLNSESAQADKQRLAGPERQLYKPPPYPYRGIGGVWLSLVEHLVRDEGVVGSNPITPTNIFPIYSLIRSRDRQPSNRTPMVAAHQYEYTALRYII